MPRSKVGPGRPPKPPANITAISIADAIEQFLSLIVAELQCAPTDSTPSAKRVVLRNLIDMLGADYPTWQISDDDLRSTMIRIKDGASPEEVAERKAAGKRPRPGRRSPGAINAASTTLRQFTELCHERGWMPTTVKVQRPIVRSRKGVQREEDIHSRVYIAVDDWPKVLDIAGEIHARVRIAVATGLYCGRRVSEVVNLQWRDIDWQTRTVHFFNRKGGRRGSIPLFPAYAGELVTWREWAESVYGPVQPEWYLTPNRVGNPLGGTNVLIKVRRYPRTWPVIMDEPARTETLISDIRKVMSVIGVDSQFGNGSHAFRRSAAQFIGDTLGLDAAQELMDHRLRSTTELYYVQNATGKAGLRSLALPPESPDNVGT